MLLGQQHLHHHRIYAYPQVSWEKREFPHESTVVIWGSVILCGSHDSNRGTDRKTRILFLGLIMLEGMIHASTRELLRDILTLSEGDHVRQEVCWA